MTGDELRLGKRGAGAAGHRASEKLCSVVNTVSSTGRSNIDIRWLARLSCCQRPEGRSPDLTSERPGFGHGVGRAAPPARRIDHRPGAGEATSRRRRRRRRRTGSATSVRRFNAARSAVGGKTCSRAMTALAIGEGVRPRKLTMPISEKSGSRPSTASATNEPACDLALDRSVRRGEHGIGSERDVLEHLDVVALDRQGRRDAGLETEQPRPAPRERLSARAPRRRRATRARASRPSVAEARG